MGPMALSEVLDLPEKLAQKSGLEPVVIAFDEFQDVTELSKDIPMEATFRSVIQGQDCARYVFLGSKTHLIQRMFGSRTRPFYKSALSMKIGKPPREESEEFVVSRFAAEGIEMPTSTLAKLLEISENIPYYLQAMAALSYRSVVSRGAGGEVENGNGIIVVGVVESAGVGNVQFPVGDTKSVGIAASLLRSHDFQRGGIDFKNIAIVAAYVCKTLIESDFARLLSRKRNLFDGAGRAVHHLHSFREVDHTVHFTAVDLQVAAGVTQSAAVGGKEDVGIEVSLGKIVKCEGGVVHLPEALTQHVNSGGTGFHRIDGGRCGRRGLFTTRNQKIHQSTSEQCSKRFCFQPIFHLA